MYEGMKKVAEDRGWTLAPANPGVSDLYSAVTLSGEVEGVPLRLERVGGAQVFVTRAFIAPPLGFHFVITHEGLAGAIKNFVGFKDVEVGDAKFDATFRIVSTDVERVRALLTNDVRDQLRPLEAQTKPLGARGFHVSEREVSVTRVTGITNFGVMTPDELLFDVPMIIEVVKALRRTSPKI
jgi:hypothetical protein